jgi:hypothetical protein
MVPSAAVLAAADWLVLRSGAEMSLNSWQLSLFAALAVPIIFVGSHPDMLGLPTWGHAFGQEPPKSFLEQKVLAPFGNTMPYTIGSLTALVEQAPGTSSNWSAETNGDYVFRFDGTDQMTKRPLNVALRFRGAAVIQMVQDGQYLLPGQILYQLDEFAMSLPEAPAKP